MDIETFRKAGYQAIDRICDYYASLENRDVVSAVQPGYLIKQTASEVPKKGEAFQTIADEFQQIIMPGITHWQHPSFFAYFPANSSFEGILADLYSSSVSNPGFNWACSPACTELELLVMDWGARMFGLNPQKFVASEGGTGHGVIMGSASEACLTVAVAARERYFEILTEKAVQIEKLDNDDVLGKATIKQVLRERKSQKLTIYGSTQTHSIGSKAAKILGYHFRAVQVNSENDLSLRGDNLRKAFEEDIKNGFIPFMVIGTVGTTSSGAIDHIGEIGQVLKDYPGVHFHIDAAWAGMSYACPEFRGLGKLDEVNQYADSWSSNFHKWGLTNFDATGLWVKDRHLLPFALDITPEYLRTKQSDSGSVLDLRNTSLSLGRRFRSLKLWFVLRSFGLEGFQSHIRKSVKLAQDLGSVIEKEEGWELVAKQMLALVVFRLKPVGVTEENDLNRINRLLYDRLSERREILLTQTVLPENVFCIRFAIGTPSTEKHHVQAGWDLIKQEARHVLENLL
ncbi:aromatic-l-amino-acid decarboxylase [Phaffia rhodozyma]|uniref:Aromatic-l-amino-acid decarboxylase n=1 Tax=Phaffia rhodozyma TaxID=264483 RepID=A0A0F7SFY9_PHARH|nr:aromatic-l-amino-acid decarboxylase [Phaffia rhodozyma]